MTSTKFIIFASLGPSLSLVTRVSVEIQARALACLVIHVSIKFRLVLFLQSSMHA